MKKENWKEKILVNAGVMLCVYFIVNSYNAITSYTLEMNGFRGEVKEFKHNTKKELTKLNDEIRYLRDNHYSKDHQ